MELTAGNVAQYGIMKLGSTGNHVKEMQLALASIGYKLKGTGYFGGATDVAVSSFQQANNLTVDGEVGPDTAIAIDRAMRGTYVAPPQLLDDATRPLCVVEGMKWLNTKEAAGGRDNLAILELAKEEGGAIAKSYPHDSVPWCALFANMTLTKVGLKGTESLWALDFVKWGVHLDGPAVGAFAPMKRPGGGHITEVVGRDQAGNIMGLGGNQMDEVSIRPFPIKRVESFRWPAGVPLPAKIGFDTLPLIKSNGRLSANES